MLNELLLLSTISLKRLFINESRKFSSGVGNGLTFDELKDIRLLLREIAIELRKRNGALS